jgi:PKD repeat protein
MIARLAGWNPDGFPTANFSGAPTTGTAPLEVSFTDLSTGEIDNRSWDFDSDGTIDSTGQNPTYTYTDPGTYTVILQIAGLGGADTETKTDYVTVKDDSGGNGGEDDGGGGVCFTSVVAYMGNGE